jgi:hypothetical protein
MNKRRMIGTVIVAMGMAALPLAASAAAVTTGLVALTLQGVGTGALAAGDCTTPAITCSTPGTCECLTGTETLLGNQGFARGSLNFALSVDPNAPVLPISNVGSCLPATGAGTISNATGKNTISINISGLACPILTENSAGTGQVETFNGTYFVTGGTAPGIQKPFTTGTGSINGAVNAGVVNGVVNVTLSGNVQR